MRNIVIFFFLCQAVAGDLALSYLGAGLLFCGRDVLYVQAILDWGVGGLVFHLSFISFAAL